MNLLLDIGNQNVKWQFGAQCGSFPSLRAELARNLALEFDSLEKVSRVVFVNVADRECSDDIKEFAAAKWNTAAIEVFAAAEQCGVLNCYRKVEELGPDRWAALIAAWSIYEQAAVVVDCGTAITVDALSAQGDFIGGSILPGFGLARDSLWQRAPGIGEFHNLAPELPARSTVEAVSSGVLFAAVGGVDLLVSEYSALVGRAPKLLLTGGTSALIAEYSDHSFVSISNLTLIGLEVISDSL